MGNLVKATADAGQAIQDAIAIGIVIGTTMLALSLAKDRIIKFIRLTIYFWS